MNFHCSRPFASVARWFSAALLFIVLSNAAHAQQAQAERWLFVFDTSSQMKKDLPATLTALEQMLGTSANGQLHKGDSVGVWTYDQQLHAGQVPLFDWEPERAAIINSNLVTYLKRQRYRDDSNLAAVQALLPHVIAISQRLTIVIFCDGNSLLRGTPYDDGVNQSFHDGLAGRKKSRQPFVLVLRTQLGKYVTCTVAYPPGNINLPPFPELPPPPPVTNKPAPPKVQAAPPAPTVPPLVIIGTKVGTNLNAKPEEPQPSVHPQAAPAATPPQAVKLPAPTNQPVQKVQPAMSAMNPPVTPPIAVQSVKPAPVKPAPVPTATNVTPARTAQPETSTNKMVAAIVAPQSNKPMASVAETPVTHTVASAISEPPAKATTPVANSGKADQQSRILIWLGVGLLAAAAVLVVILMARSGRRPRGSLISSSMQNDPRRK